MINRLCSIVILVSSLTVFSCSREMTKEEYKSYLEQEDSGLLKTRSLEKADVELRYIPNRLFTNDTSKNDLEKYVLKVRPHERNAKGILSHLTEDPEVQNQIRRYYNEAGHKEFKLEVGEERVSPYEFYFEDFQGMTDYNSFVLVFDLSKIENKEQDRVLVWNDGMLKIASQKFRIKSKDLIKEKAIKLK